MFQPAVRNPTPDDSERFASSLAGTATFLVGIAGFVAHVETLGLTFPIDFMLVSSSWADAFAYGQQLAVPDTIRDEGNGNYNQFYIETFSSLGVQDYRWSVDASMDFVLNWIFGEAGVESHNLTITAQLNYYEYDQTNHTYTYKNVKTSVNLQMGPDAYNSTSSALAIQSGVNYTRLHIGGYDISDFYKIWASQGQLISVHATSTPICPSTPNPVMFRVYVLNPSGNTVNYTLYANCTQSLSYTASSSAYWYVKVEKYTDDYWGFYSIMVNVDSGGGGGGCPYVYTWNGSQFALDNNILPTSERSNGTDVEDYYKLEQTLTSNQGEYSLLVSEFEHEHSYIDQVKLLAIDHEANVHIAVDPDGNILTYKNPTAPLSAVDNYGNNRLSEISLIDGNVSDPSTYFNGTTGDSLVLNFGHVNSDNAKLILRDDMKSEDTCIDVQVLNSNGQWEKVTTVTPRSYWAVEGVNLSPYIIKNQDLKVRLVWTSPHRLDYVGLDTTKQAAYETHYGTLISATHSTQGDVTAQLSSKDGIYAELTPGQQIQLSFTLPDNQQEARTYILYTEGHYYTMP